MPVEMDGEDDHVHLLVEYPPKVSISSLVNSLKGVSSRAASGHPAALLERRAVVAQLLRRPERRGLSRTGSETHLPRHGA